MTQAAQIVTVGDLVDDIVVWLDGGLRSGTDTEVDIYRRRGGSAANVAAFAARDGCSTRFVGQVGDDPRGHALIAELARDGVDTRVVTNGRTGTIVALVDGDAERSMLTDRGASTQLTTIDGAVLDSATILHIPAYSLAVDPLATATIEIIGEALDRSVAVTVNASSVTLLEEFGVAEFRSLVHTLRPAVFFCNRDEAMTLGLGRRGPIPGARTTVITAGPRPTVAVAADGRSISVPVESVPVVLDTTGAGDAFCAGFLAATCRAQPLRSAIESGHRLAGLVVAEPGATLVDEAESTL
ncbi:MAG: sugar kinase [Acidobacteria bacterium]|nr:sugar kinase [Acidobacteriota bacterium]